MKKKFTKILGVGLTLALLTSLLLTAAPVSALTQPIVTFPLTTDAEISEADADYIISFRIDEELVAGSKISVTLPEGTVVAASLTATIKAWCVGVGGLEEQTLTPSATRVDDTLEVELTSWGAYTITTLGTVLVTFTDGITNPDTAGSYKLTVGTLTSGDVVIEAAVTSAAYTITVPTIGVLPGIVQQKNAKGILMAQATGDDAINTLVDSAGENYTIVVGPGQYTITNTIALDQAGLTLKSSAGAADTIIKAGTIATPLVIISAAEVTVDGFTIGDVPAYQAGIQILAADAIVKNNIITAEPTEIGIFINASGATVTGNELDEDCTMYLCAVSDSTISDNIFGECLNLYPGTLAIDGLTVTDNTMIGSLAQAIDFSGTGTFTDILIEGNIISEAAGTAAIQIRDAAKVTNLRIVGNEITDNLGDGILIQGASVGTGNVIKFNTITGNDTTTGDYGIQNDAGTDVVDATFNWWGTTVAADIAAMVSGTGDVTTAPFLAGTVETVFSLSDAVANASALDAKTTVGVRVEGVEPATTISVAKYIANPEADIAGAIAYFDVYVAGGVATDAVTIKFYAGDANTTVSLWSADTDAWAPVDADFSTYGGYVYVTVFADVLGGTPFALVGGAVAAPGTPKILAPTTGDDTVSLTPIFAWEAVAGAAPDGYYFQLADNANFVTPMVKLDGDLGRLVVTAYAYVGELPYSTAYYWRVQAVSGTVAAGTLAASAWSTGVFITMDEPEEELPPVVVQEQPPVIIEPIVEVITPAATEITPSWIYVIIGVGAVLVIALLVLIVRTRRVA